MWTKVLDWVSDFLVFVLPILEYSGWVNLLAPQFYPVYMVIVVTLRQLLKVLKEREVVTKIEEVAHSPGTSTSSPSVSVLQGDERQGDLFEDSEARGRS